MDDIYKEYNNCDVVINGNIFADDSKYNSFKEEDLLIGIGILHSHRLSHGSSLGLHDIAHGSSML
jgi:hypothetical protein